jgi:hypothetical protein
MPYQAQVIQNINISAMVWHVFEDDNFRNKSSRHTYNKKLDNLESSYRK